METTNQPTIPKFRRNSSSPAKKVISIDDLLAIVAESNQYERNTNLGEGFKKFAEHIQARIIARNASKDKPSIKIDKQEFDKIYSSYHCAATTANKKRALRERLMQVGIIAHARTQTEFRDIRKDMLIQAQSVYLLLYSNAAQRDKVHEFIRTFAGLEIPNP